MYCIKNDTLDFIGLNLTKPYFRMFSKSEKCSEKCIMLFFKYFMGGRVVCVVVVCTHIAKSLIHNRQKLNMTLLQSFSKCYNIEYLYILNIYIYLMFYTFNVHIKITDQ